MKKKNVENNSSKGEVILYKASDGSMALDVKLEEETVWLTQAQLAKLFGQTKQTVSMHIRNVYKEKELEKNSTVREYLTVQIRLQRVQLFDNFG